MSLHKVECEVENMAHLLQHVEGVGEEKAYRIAEEIVDDFETMGEATKAISEHELEQAIKGVEGVGDKLYNQIVYFFHELPEAFLYNLLFMATVSPTPLP